MKKDRVWKLKQLFIGLLTGALSAWGLWVLQLDWLLWLLVVILAVGLLGLVITSPVPDKLNEKENEALRPNSIALGVPD